MNLEAYLPFLYASVEKRKVGVLKVNEQEVLSDVFFVSWRKTRWAKALRYKGVTIEAIPAYAHRSRSLRVRVYYH